MVVPAHSPFSPPPRGHCTDCSALRPNAHRRYRPVGRCRLLVPGAGKPAIRRRRGGHAAATADLDYGATTAQSAEPFALAAANNATNDQFGLTSSAVTLTYAGGIGASPAITIWQASVQIPRGSFFSGVRGPGLPAYPSAHNRPGPRRMSSKPPETDCLLTARHNHRNGRRQCHRHKLRDDVKRRDGLLDVGERLGQDYRNLREHGGRLCRNRWRLADHQYDEWFRLYRHGGNQYAG